jgi:hypothetical protein
MGFGFTIYTGIRDLSFCKFANLLICKNIILATRMYYFFFYQIYYLCLPTYS